MRSCHEFDSVEAQRRIQARARNTDSQPSSHFHTPPHNSLDPSLSGIETAIHVQHNPPTPLPPEVDKQPRNTTTAVECRFQDTAFVPQPSSEDNLTTQNLLYLARNRKIGETILITR